MCVGATCLPYAPTRVGMPPVQQATVSCYTIDSYEAQRGLPCLPLPVSLLDKKDQPPNLPVSLLGE